MADETLLVGGAGGEAGTGGGAGSAGGGEGQQQQGAATEFSYTNSEGAFSEGWLDRLPEEFKEHSATLSKYRTLPDLAKAYVHSQKLLGKKSNAVLVPGEGATEEEITAYREALGVPATPEEYKLKPEQMPEGLEWNEDMGKQFAAIAHKHNIPQSAMQELAGFYVHAQKSLVEQHAQAIEAELINAREQLQDAWKGKFDENLGKAKRVAKTIGLDIESPGLRDHNVVIALSRMADLVSEDKLVSGAEFSPTSTPGKARAIAIMKGSDPNLMHYHKLYREGDSETVKMVRDMLKNG